MSEMSGTSQERPRQPGWIEPGDAAGAFTTAADESQHRPIPGVVSCAPDHFRMQSGVWHIVLLKRFNDESF
eukprot:12897268-Prorocentrum_lima.AAC.1